MIIVLLYGKWNLYKTYKYKNNFPPQDKVVKIKKDKTHR